MARKSKKQIDSVEEIPQEIIPEVIEETPEVFTRTKQTFTYTKTVTVEVMSGEEIQNIRNTWTELENQKLDKYMERRPGATILKAWGEEGSRKVQIITEDLVLRKVWYYTKWGWSEA